MAAKQLTSAQRRYLKQLAHPLKPLVQIGKEGVTPNFIRNLLEQIGIHELIKVRILNNCLDDVRDMQGEIENAGITVVQKVGHVFTLYMKREKESQINLPGA